jgi:hypothetical protein
VLENVNVSPCVLSFGKLSSIPLKCPSLSIIDPPQSSVSTCTTSLAAREPNDFTDPGRDVVPVELAFDLMDPASDVAKELSPVLPTRSNRLLLRGGPISFKAILVTGREPRTAPCSGEARKRATAR